MMPFMGPGTGVQGVALRAWAGLRGALAAGMLLTAFPTGTTAAGVCETDDAGDEVCLDAPADRIISLSPGATELLFAAGAGDRVVGAVNYSDHPPEAEEIPRVGSHTRIDLERTVALSPDLIIGWITGNPGEQLDQLARMGIPVYSIEPQTFGDVARSVRALGRLAGTPEAADAEADRFLDEIERIRSENAEKAPVRVFYQIWEDPIMTINGTHLIHRALELCGGENVFADLDRRTPRLDREVILEADPDAIVAGGMGEADTRWLDAWERFETLRAQRNDHLYFVNPSTIQRPTPRILEGIETLCGHLDRVRAAEER